jgi:hypothetical protein
LIWEPEPPPWPFLRKEGPAEAAKPSKKETRPVFLGAEEE